MSQTSVYKYLCWSFFCPAKARPRQIKIRSIGIQFMRSSVSVHQTDITRFISTTTTASSSVFFFFYSVYFSWATMREELKHCTTVVAAAKRRARLKAIVHPREAVKKFPTPPTRQSHEQFIHACHFQWRARNFASAAGGKAAHVNRFHWARHDELKAS